MASRPIYEHLDMSLSPLERIKAVHEDMTSDPRYFGWDAPAVRALEIISADHGTVEFEMTVTESMCNKSGFLSGGFSATVLDMATSMVLSTVAKPGFMDGGSVSRSLNCTFIRALAAGERCRVSAEAISGGRKLSHAKGEILTLDGKVVVSFVQDKVEMPRSNL